MKIIKFIPTDAVDDNFIQPSASKKNIPQWYKDSEVTLEDGGNGLKTCIPYLDSLTSGYQILLWENIHVKKNEDGSIGFFLERKNKSGEVYYIESDSVVSDRGTESGALMPRPHGHGINHFVWRVPVTPKTPKGWSCLYTHPLNRFDLPFTTASGIVDTDTFYSGGNLPFFLKADFEGIIPAGTPICQLIPIKRETWTSTWEPFRMDSANKRSKKVRSFTRGGYKKMYWQKKEYD